MLKRVTLLVLLLCVVAGCSAQLNPRNELVYASQDFAKRVAWKDFSRASIHFAETNREEFLAQFEDQELMNILDVNVVSVGDSDADETEVSYRINYFRLPSTRLTKDTIKLTWSYMTVGKGRVKEWKITSPFPALGKAGKR